MSLKVRLSQNQASRKTTFEYFFRLSIYPNAHYRFCRGLLSSLDSKCLSDSPSETKSLLSEASQSVSNELVKMNPTKIFQQEPFYNLLNHASANPQVMIIFISIKIFLKKVHLLF